MLEFYEYEICAKDVGLYTMNCKSIVRGLYIFDPKTKKGALVTKKVYDEYHPEEVGETNVFCDPNGIFKANYDRVLKLHPEGEVRPYFFVKRWKDEEEELNEYLDEFEPKIRRKIMMCLKIKKR